MTQQQKEMILDPKSQKLVNRLANFFASEFEDNDLKLGTFIAAGERGLVTAAKEIRLYYDGPFLSYAIWCIIAEMEKARTRIKKSLAEN